MSQGLRIIAGGGDEMEIKRRQDISYPLEVLVLELYNARPSQPRLDYRLPIPITLTRENR
jgi:hypothetical protein